MQIYLFPFLFDFVTFLVALRVADASGRELHLSDAQAAALVMIYSLGYMCTCPVAGHLLNRRNARAILIAATSCLLLLSGPLFFTTSFWPTFVLLGFLGIVVAFCFNSFQTFMRGEAPAGRLARTIARYTVTWSSGIACGYLLGGFLKDNGGPWALASLSTIACSVILALSISHQSRGDEHDSADGAVEEHRGSSLVDTRYVVIGWLLCFSANFSQRPLMTFLPKFFAQMHRPSAMAGFLFFILLIGQALFGYFSGRLRHALYRRGPLAIAHLLNIGLLGALWMTSNYWISVVVMAALGSVYGFIYFAAVYYVSNDLRSSRNVGINEAMVGAGNILGLLLSQFFMNRFSDPQAVYPVLMATLAALAILQLGWLSWGNVAKQAEPVAVKVELGGGSV